jgi:hypothetical protein
MKGCVLIDVLDPERKHEWLDDLNHTLCYEEKRVYFTFNSDFINSPHDRVAFFAGLNTMQKAVEILREKHVCLLCIEERETGYGLLTLYVYKIQNVRHELEHFAHCQLARRATERALKHQGRIHKDIIPLIGLYIWESRKNDVWKKN